MNLLSRLIKCLCVYFTLAFGFVGLNVLAEPYLAFMNQQPCGTCHVNPTGGGMRNAYGRFYGSSLLAAKNEQIVNPEIGKITDWFLIGGDLRTSFSKQDSPAGNQQAQGFAVDSGQIYMLFSAQDPSLSFYVDQRVAPGAAINREAFVLKQFANQSYLKVGKFMPAFGIRLEDNSAFTRQVSGFNFNNSDNGIEYGFRVNRTYFTFFINNGTNALNNDDERYQFGARGEFIGAGYRFGGSMVINDAEVLQRKLASVFAGYTFDQLTFLGEWVQITEKSTQLADKDIESQIGLLEMNWQFSQGHNIKLTEEYYDPDNTIDEDHRVRHSVLYEYSPMADIQMRMGYRTKQAPPQFPAEEIDSLFVQAHFYF